MTERSTIQALSRFACDVLASELSRDPRAAVSMRRLLELLRTLSDASGNDLPPSKPISSLEQARAYFVDRDRIGGQEEVSSLPSSTIAMLVSIYVEVIDLLAVNFRPGVSAVLVPFTAAVWPLYSRDIRTAELGFNLQEYIDIFAGASASQRAQLREQLLAEINQ